MERTEPSFRKVGREKEIKPEEGSSRRREGRGNVFICLCLEGSRQEYVLV